MAELNFVIQLVSKEYFPPFLNLAYGRSYFERFSNNLFVK